MSPTGNASGTRRLHSIQPDPSAGRGAGPCGTAAIRGTRGLDAAPYRETLCMQWQRAVVLEHVVFAGGEVASQPACTHLPVDGSVEPSMPAARAVSRTCSTTCGDGAATSVREPYWRPGNQPSPGSRRSGLCTERSADSRRPSALEPSSAG